MDIDLLSKMVKELILDNDEVTLPGVGTFVAEIVPSTFSDKGYTINPPYRKLSFRQRQSEDSSLLEFYMSSNDVDKESAERILTEFLSELKDVLKQKKLIIFPGLGRLRATKENNFFFIADEDLDIYPGGFGLEPISLKTHQETREEVNEALAGLKSIIESPVSAPVADTEPEPLPIEEIKEEVSEPVVAEVPSVELPVEEVVAPSDETMAFVAGLNEIPEVAPALEEVNDEVSEVVEVEPEEVVEISPVEEEAPAIEPIEEVVPEIVPEDVIEEVKQEVIEEEVEEVPAPKEIEEPSPEPVEEVEEETAPIEPEPEAPVEEPVPEEEKKEEYKVIDDITPEPIAPNSTAQGPDIKELAKNISEPVPMPKPESKSKKKWLSVIGKILKVILVLVILAAIALLAFVLLAHIAPDFVDSILYTPEELKIINY